MIVTVAEENKLFRDLLSPDISSQEKIVAWQVMLDKGMKSTRTNVEGDSVLAIAAYMGDTELLKYALDIVKVDPNIQNKEGQTPLMLAAKEGNLAEINLLIERQADTTMVDRQGDNALDYVQRHLSHEPNYISCYDAVEKGQDAFVENLKEQEKAAIALKELTQNLNLGSNNIIAPAAVNETYLNTTMPSNSTTPRIESPAESNPYLNYGAVGLVAATAALGVAKILSRVFKPTESKEDKKTQEKKERDNLIDELESPALNTRQGATPEKIKGVASRLRARGTK